MIHRREFLQSAAALGGAAGAPWALAQSPDIVRIVCGFPAGGTADSTARRVAELLMGSAFATQGAVIDNRTGAGGRLACEFVKAAPPDGKTLLLTPLGTLSIYPHVYPSLRYDPMRDFAPVTTASMMTHALAVGPMVPASVRTVQDFITWAKANAGKASYGSPGAGTAPHFLMALLGIRSGLELTHVAYRGSVPGVTDLVGGQVAAMCTPTGDFLPFYRAGKLRILATSGAARTPFTPEVPSFAEAGHPELTIEEWYGFLAPARTPPAVVSAAATAIVTALSNKDFIDGMAALGLTVKGSSPADMGQAIKDDLERWRPLVRKIGFTAES